MTYAARRLPGATLLMIAALAGLSQPLGGQTAAPATGAAATAPPDARTLVARHLDAVGRAAGITSTRAIGTLAMPAQGITGTVEVLSARPDRSLLRAEIPGIGQLESGFDGTHAWTIDPIMGPALLDGRQLAQTRFDARFDGPFADLAQFSTLETVGRETFDGRDTWRIRVVVDGIGEAAHFFDVETGLHAGSIMTRETAMGPLEVTSMLRDYRRAGPVLEPHEVVQRMMGVEQIVRFTEIRHDDLPADAFAMPPAIRALVK